MCPTNTKIYYFFTVSGNQYYSKDKTLKHEEIVDKDIVIPFYDENVRVRVPRMNYIYNPKTNKKIIDEEYHPLIDLKPRFFEEIKYKMSAEDVKIPWTVENSLFKDYRVENEEFLEKCFLKDWDCSKIEKLLGQGNEDVIQSKAHLQSYYKKIKTSYKYYSTSSPRGEVWSIGQNVYLEFMNNSKFMSNNYPSSQVSLNFVNSNAGSLARKSTINSLINNNPHSSLIRFQFMEVLVRNVLDKYVKTGQCNNFSDGFKQCLQDGLQEDFDKQTDEQDWRDKQYWLENSEICILKFRNLLDRLFKQFAGSKTQQNNKVKFMSFEDFKAFCGESGIMGELLADRDINMAYNMSMMGQIEEISFSRHLQMGYLEFYEAVARLADVISPMPYGQTIQEEWPVDLRLNLEISMKLESLLVDLYKKQDLYFREENKITDKSLFEDQIQAILNGKEVEQRARQNVRQKSQALTQRNKSTLHRGSQYPRTSLLTPLAKKQSKRFEGGVFSVKLIPDIDSRQSIQFDNQKQPIVRQSFLPLILGKDPKFEAQKMITQTSQIMSESEDSSDSERK